MSMLKVACEDQRLYLLESTTIASGGVNETKVEFNFCPKWDGYVKTAVFYQKVGDAYYTKVGTDNTAVIPWEVTKNPGFMYFGVFGVKDGISRTSEVMAVRIVPGAITAETVPTDPTPDIYIQFLSEYAIIREMMITVEQNTAASASNAKQSENNALAAETHVGEMKTEVKTLVNGFDTHVGEMKTEIDTFKDNCKTEIDEFTEECKTELENYVNESGVATITDVRKAAPRNLLDNSDFTQFVAQAGIGGMHGTQAYAGDRWVLDSGTVTGNANANANGYTNITLNGTIRQIVANQPSVGSPFVEMVSGTAEITYENGEITITSNGGVIKNVALYDGNYNANNQPKYQPKGYGTELAECQRYFIKMTGSSTSVRGFGAVGSPILITPTFYLPTTMRTSPTAVSFDVSIVRGNGISLNSITPTEVKGAGCVGNQIALSLTFSDNALNDMLNHIAAVYGNNLVLSADL